MLWNPQGFAGMAARMSNAIAAVILAAGKGTRMKSDLHKVLHPIAGRPMLLHLMDGLAALSPARTVVVVGDKRDQVAAALAGTGAVVAVQDPQLGTAHAALQARAALADRDGIDLVCFGTCPILGAGTVRRGSEERRV